MADKDYICTDCSKRFVDKAARQQHWRDTQCEKGHGTKITTNDPAAVQAREDNWQSDLAQMDSKTRMDVFKSVVDDDLSDGAYFAMAQEFGLEVEDFVEDDHIDGDNV